MTKKIRPLLLFLAVFIFSPSLIIAQEQEPKNQINFGSRFSIFGENSDKARFQRYNDFSDGWTLDKVRLNKKTKRFSFKFNGNHIGYQDQEFSGSYNQFGKLRISGGFNQMPLFYSDSVRTLYTSSIPGVLMIDDSIQRGMENKTLTLFKAANNASLFELRNQRNITDFKLKYSPTESLAYNLTFKNTQISGSQPWGTNFGFTLANEVPLPIDRRTTDLGASVELSNKYAYWRFGYDGSFFNNDIPVFTWDNPLRISDSPTAGPSMGREALWPSTNKNSVNTASGFKLPAHSHITAFLSLGQLSNNNPLIPFTVNSALPVIPLSREMSGIRAKVVAMNYTFTSRPTNWLFINTRYKQYRLDNQTEPFEVERSVGYDTNLSDVKREAEPLSFNRQTVDTDLTWSPLSYLGLQAGFTRELLEQTHRAVEESTEDTGRISLDLTGISWLSFRGIFEHSIRSGHFDGMRLFADGQQPSLRQYDISDRNKDRYSLIALMTPISQLSLNSSFGLGKEYYPATDTRTVFGLRNNNNRSYSVGFDLTPIDKISLGANYGYEKYSAFQVSRTAAPLPPGGSLNDLTQQFNDPRRDWTDDSNDRTKTYDTFLDLLNLIPKTKIKLSYDDIRSKSTYVYGLALNTIITAPIQLPPITNRLRQKMIDSRYFATKHIAFGLIYRFNQYEVNDFAFNPRESLAEPSAAAVQNYLSLGNFQRPYKASTVIGQFSYFW